MKETRVFFIPGLVIVPLDGLSQAFELINAGLQSRSMASQNLNETSSRSHLILTVYLKRKVLHPLMPRSRSRTK
jgi:hypothetical protein